MLNEAKTKVLMIYHTRLRKWIIPGGHVEGHEAPHEAALRETKEETAGNHAPQEMDGARWVTKVELLQLDTFESIRQLCRTLMA